VSEFRARRPAQIDTSVRHWIPSFDRYAVIAPFAAYDSRNWPQEKWRELAVKLNDAGIVPIIIAMDRHRERTEKAFTGCDVMLCVGHPADAVLDLICHAFIVIGNDSGIAHIGGLMGSPTVAVHAGTFSHSFLYDFAPSVTSVTAGNIGHAAITLARSGSVGGTGAQALDKQPAEFSRNA
jgi:ADP-heptose:LPS heptosyltransferase